MGENWALILALEVANVVVLAASSFAFYRSTKVWRNLRGKEGERLSFIVMGVLAAFVVAQLLSMVNVLILFQGESDHHVALRLAQQAVLTVAAVWAALKLRHFA